MASLFWCNCRDEEVDKCFDVLLVDDLAELAEVWDVRALLVDKLPKEWNCVLFEFLTCPLEEVLADITCDAVFFRDWDTCECLWAKADLLADGDLFEALLEPLHDNWDVLLDK